MARFSIFSVTPSPKKIFRSENSKKYFLAIFKHASNNAFRTSIPPPHPSSFFIIQHPAVFFSKIRDFPIVFDRIYYRKSMKIHRKPSTFSKKSRLSKKYFSSKKKVFRKKYFFGKALILVVYGINCSGTNGNTQRIRF